MITTINPYLVIVGVCLASIGVGIIISFLIRQGTPSGTIIIEEYSDEHDLFRFDLGVDLDEIKQMKQIIFEVKVVKFPEDEETVNDK